MLTARCAADVQFIDDMWNGHFDALQRPNLTVPDRGSFLKNNQLTILHNILSIVGGFFFLDTLYTGHITMNIGVLRLCRIYYSDLTITNYTSNERASQTVCPTSVQYEHPSSHGTHRVDSRVRHMHHSLWVLELVTTANNKVVVVSVSIKFPTQTSLELLIHD